MTSIPLIMAQKLELGDVIETKSADKMPISADKMPINNLTVQQSIILNFIKKVVRLHLIRQKHY